MNKFQGNFKNWNAQKGKGILDSQAFHFKNPRNLQHFLGGTIPTKDLAFLVIYFTTGAVLLEVQFCFEFTSCIEIGCTQYEAIVCKLGVIDILNIWDNSNA